MTAGNVTFFYPEISRFYYSVKPDADNNFAITFCKKNQIDLHDMFFCKIQDVLAIVMIISVKYHV